MVFKVSQLWDHMLCIAQVMKDNGESSSQNLEICDKY